jgi:cytochrome b561
VKQVIRDTKESYGIVSRLLHWGMAVAIFALFALGVWMVGLDYYSPYYKSAPDLHRSLGILMFAVLLLRLAWRFANVKPDRGVLTPIERQASRLVHAAFYVLLVALMLSGYLISTADGRSIEVFNWFSVRSLGKSEGLEDAAGIVHEWVAYAVIVLAALHTAAASKHRIFDRDKVSNRMW